MAARHPSSAATDEGRRSTTPRSAREFNVPLVHESVRAELAARRQGTHATKTRGKVRGGGAKPWRQKGTGRARAGSIRAPALDRRRHRLRPLAAPLHLQGQPQGAPRRAAQRAVGARRARDTIAVFDPRRLVDDAQGEGRRRLLADWADGGSVLVVLTEEQARAALSFRNLERVSSWPPRTSASPTSIGAAAVLASEEALDALTAAQRRPPQSEAAPDGPQPGASSAPSSARRATCSPRSTSTRSASTPTRTRRRSARPSRHVLRRQGGRRPHDVGQVQAQAPRLISGRTRSWKKAIVQVRAGDSIPIFQGLQGLEG